MGIADTKSANRNKRTICLPFSQDNYECNIHNPVDFRICVDKRIELFPELFPAEIINGYQMKDIYYSKKQSVWIRRVKIAGVAYTVRPSFIMPYLVGFVDEIEKALFLRKFNVPFWAVSYFLAKIPCIGIELSNLLGETVLSEQRSEILRTFPNIFPPMMLSPVKNEPTYQRKLDPLNRHF